MKKKNLLWLCALPIVVSPAFLALSYCSPLETSLKQITAGATANIKLSQLKNASPSLKTLLYGDKSYNNGNYIVIIGTSNSAKAGSLNSFFFGNEHEGFWDNNDKKNMVVPKNADVNIAAQDIKTHINEKTDGKNSGFAIASYIEADTRVQSGQEYGRDDNNKGTLLPCSPLNPFDKFTKNDYLYNGSNKKYKEGTYIRQDPAAKEYRGIAEELKKLFPSVDLSDGNTIQKTKSIAIQWVYGYPVIDGIIDTSNENFTYDSFTRAAETNFDRGYDAGWWKK